jgi:ketosteroid isomerase-like protein
MNTREILDSANSAMEEGRLEDFLALCNPDVVMRWPGTPEEWEGIETIRQKMCPMMEGGQGMKVNVIEKIVESNRAMGHGTMEIPKEDGSTQTLYFSDVYRFENGRIAEITSYMLGMNGR